MAACAVDAVALLGAYLAGRADSLVGLGAAVFVTGLANAVFSLARQAYLTEAVPIHARARAMSTLGGVFRLGSFIGPFAGALVVSRFSIGAAYAFAAAMSLLAAVLVAFLPDVGRTRRSCRRSFRGRPAERAVRPGPAPAGAADPRTRRAGHLRGPSHPAGDHPVVGRSRRDRSRRHQPDLRHLGRGRPADVLPRRRGDGPVRPGLGGGAEHDHHGTRAAAAATHDLRADDHPGGLPAGFRQRDLRPASC